MKNLAIQTIQSSQTLAMSSREIAERTGKRHDNVLADIRSMLAELHGEEGVLRFQGTQINQQNGQSYPVFMLPKRETLILVSGYSVSMRAAIVDRWQELESLAAPVALLPDHTAEVKALESQLAVAKRKKALADEYNTLATGISFAPKTQQQLEDEFTIKFLQETTAKDFFNLEAAAVRRKDNPFMSYQKRGESRQAFRKCIDRLINAGKVPPSLFGIQSH